jgi:alpha-tubulin suppressor-like RCC1 family protein
MSSRLRGVVALLVSWVVVGVLASLAPVSASAVVTTPGGLTSLSPSRLLDTRIGVGAPKSAVAAGGTVGLQVTGRGGVPASGVSAVVLNVTVTAPAKPGYITVFANRTLRPGASNLNFVAGQTVANLVIAQVGQYGRVNLYNGSTGTVQLIADVSGYYLAGTPIASGTFQPLPPSRVLDTRTGTGAPKAAVAAGGTVALQILGRGGVPAGASVVVLNVTVTAPAKPGYLTVYGEGTTRPTASNLNFVAGQTVPNLVIAQTGPTGKVVLYNGSTGTVQLVADVAGYYLFGMASAEGTFRSLAPYRVLDTRDGVGAPDAAVVAAGTVHLKVTDRGGVPAFGVSAVVLNVTATAPARAGYTTVYADLMPRPTASNLNFATGQTVPNLIIAPVGTNGTVDLFNGGSGTVQLIADVAGYYLSGTPGTGYATYAWGSNSHGQLGEGSTANDQPAPIQVGTDSSSASVEAGYSHTAAVKSSTNLCTWGFNANGQLGDGTTTDRIAPVTVGSGWASVSAGSFHTMAINTDSSLWAWGTNFYGRLGDGTQTEQLAPVKIGTDRWASVSAGGAHTVAVRTDGTLWAWGSNSNGQLGDGTATNRFEPVKVGTDTHWAMVSAGGAHTVAVRTDGTLWAWGANSNGRLGDGTTTDRHAPVRVGSDTRWASVSAGDIHSLAVRTDGTLWAWGYNYDGELGDGTSTTRQAPVQVGTDAHWASVAVGGASTVAVKTDGTLWAWGRNAHGQVGDGTTTTRYVPVQVGINNHWVSVTAGDSHTVGLRW